MANQCECNWGMTLLAIILFTAGIYFLVWGFISLIGILSIFGIITGKKNKLKNLVLRENESIEYYEPNISIKTIGKNDITKTIGYNCVLTNQRLFILNTNTIVQVFDFSPNADKRIGLYKQSFVIPLNTIKFEKDRLQMNVDYIWGIQVETNIYFRRLDRVQKILLSGN